ncbi:OmpA family protein [Oleiagrimonas soli]|uniref:Outer membrane protein OmpA-like peptidoglycan-associated protein n=1 Tax=Oleiagrimonas soli TaxID=1543381 RepID=A0A841KGT0_9GAMM|nr:OmpA family protein [Oleiagrimonas soli]MBB6184255.1 outer membrane protein OmpA-like peptidoglycan-associated protein [Oleiagrimonas soli]
MNVRMIRLLVVASLALLSANALAGSKDDLDVQRLTTSLNQLDNDPTLGQYAQAERSLARVAVQRLEDAGSSERPHALYLAERSVDQAKASAQLEDAQHQLNQLSREHDKILLQASRQDAEATRRELERQRLENQLAAEETQRLQEQGQAYSEAAEQARAEAEQAKKLAEAQSRSAALARKQADLAVAAARALRARMEGMTAHQGSKGRQMTVTGDAFAPGQSTLRPEARQHLGKLIQFVQSQPSKPIRIEGYTDATGSASANKALSQQRAQAVRNALIAAGVSASRMSTVGMGEADPVASNATASGRAMNRRVVVILRDQ